MVGRDILRVKPESGGKILKRLLVFTGILRRNTTLHVIRSRGGLLLGERYARQSQQPNTNQRSGSFEVHKHEESPSERRSL